MEGRFFGEETGEMPPIGNMPETFQDISTGVPLESKRNFDINKNFKTDMSEIMENEKSDIRDLILEKVKKARITPDNGPGIAGNIIAELDIKDKETKRIVQVEVAIMEKIKRDEEIARLNSDKKDLSRRNKIHHLLLRNAKFLGLMDSFMEEIKNNPKESKIFWQHQEYLHAGHNNAENYKKERNGIIAAASVKDAIKSEIKDIEFVSASPDQDVDEATDGFMKIKKDNGKTETLPYQVKALSLNVSAHQNEWRYGKNERQERFQFIVDNMITVIPRSLAERVGKGGFSKNIYERKTDFIKDKEKELNEIIDKIFLNNNADKAIVIFVPSGKIEDNGRPVLALNENGTMQEKIKTMFISQFRTKVLGEKPEIKQKANIDKKNKSNIIKKRAGRRI